MTTLRTAAQQALEAMGYVGADWICEASHHAKKDQHKLGEPCPLQQRWHVAYQALRAALAEPAQEPTKAMIDAAERIDWSDADVRGNIINMWQAMIAASSQSAQQQEPVQEPQGCDHCNHPLYAAVKCSVCGRVTEPVQEPVLTVDALRVEFERRYRGNLGITRVGGGAYLSPAIETEWQQFVRKYTTPPQRKPRRRAGASDRG